MKPAFTAKETNKIYKGIRKKYKKVAKKPEGLFKYPTGKKGLEALQYDPKIMTTLPDSVLASYCGVGNPFSMGAVNPGDAILDFGCGSGVDTLFAAKMTGPTGRVVGIDLIPEMLQRAGENLRLVNLENVSYEDASSDKLPFPDDDFEVAISNGVINLVPDKAGVIAELIRVLKPGGRLMIADQILIGELTKDRKQIIKSWFQ